MRDDEVRSSCFAALDVLQAKWCPTSRTRRSRKGFGFRGRKVPFLSRAYGIYRSADAQRGPARSLQQLGGQYTYFDMKTISTIVRGTRLDAGLTQDALAHRAGTSQPAVAAYESGRRVPTLATLTRLLGACGHELVVDSRPASTDGRTRLTLATLRRRRGAILATAAKHGAGNVRVFGSVARGDVHASSDLDLLVDLDDGRTLVDLASLREELGELLGAPVDVATADILKPSIARTVEHETVML